MMRVLKFNSRVRLGMASRRRTLTHWAGFRVSGTVLGRGSVRSMEQTQLSKTMSRSGFMKRCGKIASERL